MYSSKVGLEGGPTLFRSFFRKEIKTNLYMTEIRRITQQIDAS